MFAPAFAYVKNNNNLNSSTFRNSLSDVGLFLFLFSKQITIFHQFKHRELTTQIQKQFIYNGAERSTFLDKSEYKLPQV